MAEIQKKKNKPVGFWGPQLYSGNQVGMAKLRRGQIGGPGNLDFDFSSILPVIFLLLLVFVFLSGLWSPPISGSSH